MGKGGRMLKLSATDELIYGRFMEEGIFEELKPESIPQADGVIAVLCADGDRFHDAMQDIWDLGSAQRTKRRSHACGVAGGATQAAEDPFANPITLDVCIDDDAPMKSIEEIRFRLIFPNGEHLVIRTKTKRLLGPMTSVVLLANIKAAEEMNGIETLLLVAHAPCGVANNLGWDLAVITAKVLAAEDVVRERIAGEHDLHIVPICRVLRGEREVAHRVNRERFAAWNARR
ncbi:MAG: hypothetical protein Q7R85_02420 [bacterium]|nr:hypothetical protein [bacterium]